jgi:hypothetical protein
MYNFRNRIMRMPIQFQFFEVLKEVLMKITVNEVWRLLDLCIVNDSWKMTNVTYKFLSIYLFFIFSSLRVSSTSCSSSGETNCVNTTSGNCHSVLVAVCRLGVNSVRSQPPHDTATNTEWQLPEVVLTQIFSPDYEHDVLETGRELTTQYKY